MHFVATAAIEAHGPEEVRKAIATGSHLATLAFSEAGSRSHFWATQSKATALGDDVVIDTRCGRPRKRVARPQQHSTTVGVLTLGDALGRLPAGPAPGTTARGALCRRRIPFRRHVVLTALCA